MLNEQGALPGNPSDAFKRVFLDIAKGLKSNSNTTLQEKIRKDKFLFARQILGNEAVFPETLEGDWGKLFRFVFDEFIVQYRFGQVLSPRNTYKSTLLAALVLWLIAMDRNIRILYMTNTHPNAILFSKGIQRHLEGNQLLIEAFGTFKPENATEESGVWRQDFFFVSGRTTQAHEPTFTAASVGITKVGEHFDVILVDDPCDQENTKTAEGIRGTIEWMKVIPPLLDKRSRYGPGGALLDNGTRYADGEVHGWILGETDDKSSPHKLFHSIILKAMENPECWDGEKGEFIKPKLNFPFVLSKPILDAERTINGPYWFYCNPGDAPILMADWTFRRLDEVRVGDWVMGFESRPGIRRKLVPSQVQFVESHIAKTQKVYLDSGNEIRCTPEHKWYTGKEKKGRNKYSVAKVGMKLLRVCDSYKKIKALDPYNSGYLAGMLDGEGSICNGYISIAQSETMNEPVCRSIEKCLDKVGIKYSSRVYSEHFNVRLFLLSANRSNRIVLCSLNWGKLDRFKKETWRKSSGGVAVRKERIVKIEPHGQEMVYGLQTSTGNYVAWEYASSNSQYQNEVTTPDDAKFKPGWFRLIQGYDAPPMHMMRKYLFTDYAFGIDDNNDRTALWVVGLDWERKAYVLDFDVGRWGVQESVERSIEYIQKYDVEKMAVEDVSLNEGIRSELERRRNQMRLKFVIEKIGGRSTETKQMRVMSMQPRFENRRIFFVVRDTNDMIGVRSNWLSISPSGKPCGEIYDEFVKFPRARHDDIPDALSDIDKISGETKSYFFPGASGFQQNWHSGPTTINGKVLYSFGDQYGTSQAVKTSEPSGGNFWTRNAQDLRTRSGGWGKRS